jgi:esterase/lipase
MPVNNNITNPSIASGSTPLRVVTGTYHLVIATGASVTVAPIYGLVKSIIATIALIWNGTSLLINSRQCSSMNKVITDLTTDLNIEKDNFFKKAVLDKTFGPLFKKEFEKPNETLANLEKEYDSLKTKQTDLADLVQESKQALFAGVLTTIPLFGVVLASAYLKVIHPIEETGAHGLVEAGFSELTRDLIRLLRMVSKNGDTLLQNPVYPVRGESISDTYEYNIRIFNSYLNKDKNIYPEYIKIPVNRGENQSPDLKGLDAAWIKNKKEDAPTMVVFHGNQQTMYSMPQQIAFYYEQGFNVLAVTMGGYPGSDEDKVITSESSTYQDADAVIKYLKDVKKATDIGVHGTSIGGTLAFAAAELHSDIKLVVADQTLDMAKNVGANNLKNVIGSIVPTAIIRGIVSGIFSSRVVHGLKNSDNTPYRTDGLNNLRKTKKMTADLFVIMSDQDHLMGRNNISRDKDGLYFRENFAGDLFRAKYPLIKKDDDISTFTKEEEEDYVKTLAKYELNQFRFSGGHCDWDDSKIIRKEDSKDPFNYENPFHEYFPMLKSNSEEKE